MIPSHAELFRTFSITAVLLATVMGCSAPPVSPIAGTAAASISADSTDKFLLIAHRGASGYRPEHTLAAYQLAIDQGADFIEPDLVPTKDGVLIARHENALAVVKLLENGQIERNNGGEPIVLSATTDVAERPEFAHLLSIRQIDGRTFAGWFSEDFTFAEIQTLFARERIPKLRPNNTAYTKLRIPSLKQILDLVQAPGNAHIGLYPELKHPTHFRFGLRSSSEQAIAIDTAKLLTTQLAASGFTDEGRLYIQCFEVETLRRLKHQLLPEAEFSAPLVQLISGLDFELPDVQFHQTRAASSKDPGAYLENVYGPLARTLSDNGTYRNLVAHLSTLASDYATGVGPRKSNARAIARQTQELGLELHPYTVRAEAFFLDTLRGALAASVTDELDALKTMGATGVFIDQPDLGVQWRSQQSATLKALAAPQTGKAP